MLVQLTAALGLIAATVAIQALFMSTGLRTLRWVKDRPMSCLTGPHSDSDLGSVPNNSDHY